MRRILFFTLLVFCVAVVTSCRKDTTGDVDLKTYDQQQIQAYMNTNGLTDFKRDLSGGDTTGIYYKILNQGTGKTLDYSDQVTLVFTVKTLDGSFVAIDTIQNHVYNYVGHLSSNSLPKSMQAIMVNIIKNKGTRARVIIPSHLAYGTPGTILGTGGPANTIKGNQSLDYYVNVVDNLDTYDDISVKNYIAVNNLTGFTKTASGLYYKITQTAAGTPVAATSILSVQYTAVTFDGLATSEFYNGTDGTGATIDVANDTRKGLAEALKMGTAGCKMTVIMPSRLSFGLNYYDDTVPAFSCMRYDINILSVQ